MPTMLYPLSINTMVEFARIALGHTSVTAMAVLLEQPSVYLSKRSNTIRRSPWRP
jgi:hypothetical protein